jgi:hypothetical protein
MHWGGLAVLMSVAALPPKTFRKTPRKAPRLESFYFLLLSYYLFVGKPLQKNHPSPYIKIR